MLCFKRGKLTRALNDMKNDIHADRDCKKNCEKNRKYFKLESPYFCKFGRPSTENAEDPPLLPHSLIECPEFDVDEVKSSRSIGWHCRIILVCVVFVITLVLCAFWGLGMLSCPFGSVATHMPSWLGRCSTGM